MVPQRPLALDLFLEVAQAVIELLPLDLELLVTFGAVARHREGEARRRGQEPALDDGEPDQLLEALPDLLTQQRSDAGQAHHGDARRGEERERQQDLEPEPRDERRFDATAQRDQGGPAPHPDDGRHHPARLGEPRTSAEKREREIEDRARAHQQQRDGADPRPRVLHERHDGAGGEPDVSEQENAVEGSLHLVHVFCPRSTAKYRRQPPGRHCSEDSPSSPANSVACRARPSIRSRTSTLPSGR
jgi:hypothetical protein